MRGKSNFDSPVPSALQSYRLYDSARRFAVRKDSSKDEDLTPLPKDYPFDIWGKEGDTVPRTKDGFPASNRTIQSATITIKNIGDRMVQRRNRTLDR